MTSFQELPAELLEKILLCLDIKDVFSCQRVSKSFHDTIQNSVDIDYHVQLQRSGHLDDSNCTRSTFGKRDALENSEFCWSSKSFIPRLISGEARLRNRFRITQLLGITDRFVIYGARDSEKDGMKTTHILYTLFPSSVDTFMHTVNAGIQPQDWILYPPDHLEGAFILGFASNLDENDMIAIVYG